MMKSCKEKGGIRAGIDDSQKICVLVIAGFRPEILQRLLGVLNTRDDIRVFLHQDGARRSQREKDLGVIRSNLDAFRSLSNEIKGDYSCREDNIGVRNLDQAISWFFSIVCEGIILEEDCIPTESFFDFLRFHLEDSRDNKQIIGISGFASVDMGNKDEYYLSSFCVTWGWATWGKKWIELVSDKYRLTQSPELARFPFLSYLDVLAWSLITRSASKEFKDYWDYRMLWLMIENKKLFIFPGASHITNVGHGETASHTKKKIYKFRDASSMAMTSQERLNISLAEANTTVLYHEFGEVSARHTSRFSKRAVFWLYLLPGYILRGIVGKLMRLR